MSQIVVIDGKIVAGIIALQIILAASNRYSGNEVVDVARNRIDGNASDWGPVHAVFACRVPHFISRTDVATSRAVGPEPAIGGHYIDGSISRYSRRWKGVSSHRSLAWKVEGLCADVHGRIQCLTAIRRLNRVQLG